MRNGKEYFININQLVIISGYFQQEYKHNNGNVISTQDKYRDEGFGVFLESINDVAYCVPDDYCWEVYFISKHWDCPNLFPFIPCQFLLDSRFL